MSEELKLLPCPACEDEVQIGTIEDDYAPCVYYSATCLCGYHGPKEITKKEAAQQHNLLPRALTWTTEPPAIGWNWWRLGTEWLPVARYVHSDGSIDNELLGRTWDEIGGQWCPIPIPKEPTP